MKTTRYAVVCSPLKSGWCTNTSLTSYYLVARLLFLLYSLTNRRVLLIDTHTGCHLRQKEW